MKISKDFFVKHFGVPEKKLAWGLLVKTTKDSPEEEIRPCLMIRNSHQAIDIIDGRIRSRYTFATEKVEFLPADMQKLEGDEYLFTAKGNREFHLTMDMFDNTYRYRSYTKKIRNEIIV